MIQDTSHLPAHGLAASAFQHGAPVEGTRLDSRWVFAIVQDPGEDWWYWLLDSEHQDGPFGCNCPDCCPHEQTGRLPRVTRDKLGLIPRCGAPRTDGEPCRAQVDTVGEHCHAHQQVNR